MPVYERPGKRGSSYFYKFTIRGHTFKATVPEARTKKQAEHVEMLARQAVFENKYMQFVGTMDLEKFVHDIYLPWAKHKKSYFMEEWYCEMILNHSAFKGKKLGEISQITLEQFRVSRRSGVTRNHAPRSLNTINREMACVSKILGLAVDNGYLDRNPARLITPYQVSGRRTRITTPDEDVVIFGEACAGRFDRIFPIAVLARYAGMRRGEILATRSEFLDFSSGLIKLPGEVTKNGQPREIPMCGLVREVLEGRGTGMLFKDYPSRQQVSTLFLEAAVRHGIQGVTLHILRHTFASRLEDYGFGGKECRDLLGHSPKTMTEHYQHSTPESRRKAIEAIEINDPLAKSTRYVHEAVIRLRQSKANLVKSTG
jgi:integrase